MCLRTIPCTRLFLEILTVAQLVKVLPIRDRTQSSITVFKRAGHKPLTPRNSSPGGPPHSYQIKFMFSLCILRFALGLTQPGTSDAILTRSTASRLSSYTEFSDNKGVIIILGRLVLSINPLKTKRISFIWGLSAYRAVNTLHFGYKNQSLDVL
jgi:hypothetical protein